MAHGSPDYSATAPLATVYGVQDIGELAARLGSVVTFDRRGNVVWIDDFESGIAKWAKTEHGAGASVSASAARARNGAFSAKFILGTDNDAQVWLSHYWFFPVMSKIGFEISFTNDHDVYPLAFTEDLYDGTHKHQAAVYYYNNTNKLCYLDEDGLVADLATDLDLAEGDFAFRTVKFVIDMATEKYVRVIFDNVEYDMSGISYYKTANAALPMWIQQVGVYHFVTESQDIYMDDAILTQNEP